MSGHKFKTIYFPKNRVRSGLSTKINISIPMSKGANNWGDEFLDYVSSLNTVGIREAINDPYLDDLEEMANKEHRSLSNVVLKLLNDSFIDKLDRSQLVLPFDSNAHNKSQDQKANIGVTFNDSLRKGAYGWYPYVEGFSANYARDAVLRNKKKPKSIYDPFGGSGTVQLAASHLGINSYYSELNPFMVEVCEAKITSASWARNNLPEFKNVVNQFLISIEEKKLIEKSQHVDLTSYNAAFPDRDFFENQHIKQLLAAFGVAKDVSQENQHVHRLLKIACAANAVACSNMTRRADLRRRRVDEYKNRIVNVSEMISATSRRILDDISRYPVLTAPTLKISNDAKIIPEAYEERFDLVLTSPPYLNGTNYFRNTKIELWLMSCINTEKDLKKYRDMTVTGGINDVSKKDNYYQFEPVEKIACELDDKSRDKRIPKMVRHYFSDMFEVLRNISFSLKSNGSLLLDIGDSKFYGVHVPTHRLLIDVAEEAGLCLVNENLLAKRMSRDKSELVQVELVFRKS